MFFLRFIFLCSGLHSASVSYTHLAAAAVAAVVPAAAAVAAAVTVAAPAVSAAAPDDDQDQDDPQTAVTAATVVSKAHETFTSLKVGRDRRRSLASVPFYGPPLSPVPRGRKFC